MHIKAKTVHCRHCVGQVRSVRSLDHSPGHVGFCGGQSGAGAGFLRVLRFPLPIFIPPIAPQSPSTIMWGRYCRPVVAAVPSGLSLTPTNAVRTTVAIQRPRDRRMYKALCGQRVGKHVPAATYTSSTIEELCFLCGSCREIIRKGQHELRRRSVRESVKRGLGLEAEEWPLLEAVA
jgi:hypothetical protein